MIISKKTSYKACSIKECEELLKKGKELMEKERLMKKDWKIITINCWRVRRWHKNVYLCSNYFDDFFNLPIDIRYKRYYTDYDRFEKYLAQARLNQKKRKCFFRNFYH